MPDPVQGVKATDALGVNPAEGTGGGAASGGTPAATATPAVDSADVAQAQALLETIGALSSAIPAVNQARITEIQQAIAAGTLPINPQTVAEKMAQIEQLLSGTAPKSP